MYLLIIDIYRYNIVDSGHPETPITTMLGELIFENPCSYEAVEIVILFLCGCK